ncbi:MAG: DUF2207 domain-containing protein [Chloroflexi bacterium]|nr:DUF2207 domain-containing protein [Chloroflexota bacterium]
MRRRLAVMLAVGILAMLAARPAGAQSRSVFWERWDVLIDSVDTFANRFNVSERYDIYFTGTFRFGSAVIPLQNLEDIRSIRVYENGELLRESCSEQPGTYCVDTSSAELAITYYFTQPATNERRQFEIAYTVEGALRIYEGGDQLWWTVIPSEHYGFSIGSSTVTVQMPAGYGPREGVDPVVTYGAPADVQVRGTTAGGATVTAQAARQISGDEFFEIRVQYPHNPMARVPSWQSDFDRQRLFEETTKPLIDLGLIVLSLLVAIGGGLGVYALWYTRGRDPKVGPVPAYLTEPPTALPPAVVGTLLDEQADLRDVISTIVDLARRGYLVMEEEQTEGLFGVGKTRKYFFKRTDKPLDDLRRFEQRIMSALFGGNRMERSLDSLKNTFYAVIPKLQDDLYEAVVEEGLFTAKPSTTRAMWSGLGTVMFVVALIAGFGGFTLIEQISPTLLCVPAAFAFIGLAAMIVGQHMPAKTRQGSENAAKWRAFREYLQNLDKYSDLKEAAGHFDDYLPFAIAFGLDRSWVRRFSQLEYVPIPVWYYPTYMGGRYRGGYRPGTPLHPFGADSGRANPGELARAGDGGFSLDDMSSGLSGGLEAISGGLTEMLESASRVMTSRPEPASTGTSGHWSSGGRSWSGGGFKGGGSSGGGSRGFG